MSVIDAIIARKLCGGGGSVPKPLTYDYMPEGYPSKTVQTTVLMEEQEVAFSDMGGIYGAALTDALNIVEGQTYIVSWDGTEYECVCGKYSGNLLIGNTSIAGMGENTGEPFIYFGISEMCGTLDTSPSHTISVKTTGEVVTQMAEEFLPPSLAAPIKTGSLLRGNADNGKWSEVDADGGYGYTDGQTVIDWDGQGSGKTKVSLFDVYYYNVSEKVPSSEELIGGIAVGSTETRPLTISSDNCVEIGGVITIEGVYKNLSIFVVPNDDFHFEYSVAENLIEADFPKKGVYFAKYPGSDTDFVHSLTYGNEIVHQIAEKYLPEVVRSGDKEIILSSSTTDSTKKFKITVDDSGTISATELT